MVALSPTSKHEFWQTALSTTDSSAPMDSEQHDSSYLHSWLDEHCPGRCATFCAPVLIRGGFDQLDRLMGLDDQSMADIGVDVCFWNRLISAVDVFKHATQHGATTTTAGSPAHAASPSVPRDPCRDLRGKVIESQTVVGGGNFGRVYRGQYMGQAVAVKEIHTETGLKADRKLLQELETHARVPPHDHVLPLLGAFKGSDGLYRLVTPLVNEGSLQQWLESKGHWFSSPLRVAVVLKGLISGLQHLHRNKVVHRDSTYQFGCVARAHCQGMFFFLF